MTDLVNANCEIPEEVIERSRVYRSSEFEKNHGGVWDSWCDGYQNKGHFSGIDTVSIMAKSAEVRLCKDCRDALFNSEPSSLCPTVR